MIFTWQLPTQFSLRLGCVKGRFAQALDTPGGSGFFLGSAARENIFVKVPVTQNKIL
jgi:hypothetical protein